MYICVYTFCQVKNYYVGAGMNSTGIATAGGFGKALAEWIHIGEQYHEDQHEKYAMHFSIWYCVVKVWLVRYLMFN